MKGEEYRVTNSANDIISSLKGSLEDQLPQKPSEVKSHEVDSQTLTFIVGSEEHTFPYTQIRYMNRTKERILVAAYSANITVKGRRLERHYNQLRRYKLSIISESASEEEGQVFIESIAVTYNQEEENHE